jgi:hypothetical protein
MHMVDSIDEQCVGEVEKTGGEMGGNRGDGSSVRRDSSTLPSLLALEEV